MRLNVALGHTIFHTGGAGAEVHQALSSALVAAERLGQHGCTLQILWSIFANATTTGNYRAALPCIARTDALIAATTDHDAAPMRDRMAALTYHLLGDQNCALAHAKAAQRPLIMQPGAVAGDVFAYDHKIAVNSHYARILWLTGHSEQAAEITRLTLAYARGVDQPFALGYFLAFAACPIAFWTGDHDALRRHLALLMHVTAGTAFNIWQITGKLYESALAALTSATPTPFDDTNLTDFQCHTISTIDWRLLSPRAAAQADAGEIHWATAEIKRAQGEALLHAHGDHARPEAEKLFAAALALSRQQNAIAWERRAAASLARLHAR